MCLQSIGYINPQAALQFGVTGGDGLMDGERQRKEGSDGQQGLGKKVEKWMKAKKKTEEWISFPVDCKRRL